MEGKTIGNKIIAITAKKGGITWSLKNWHCFGY